MKEIVNNIAAPAPKEVTFDGAYSNSLAVLPSNVEEQLDIYSTHELLKLNPLQ